jgi:NADH:ubiquinone reductase (H+-translocating)
MWEKIGEVILIDRNPYHQLLQEIHLVAADFKTANEVQIPILKLIDRTSIKFIQSAVKQIMPDKNMVGLESTKIHYDLLIVCLGASIKYFNIKGARENTLLLHSISDASWSVIRWALLNSNRKHDIVIVGGGATGVSLGGALSDFVKGSKKSDMLTITIIEALPTILSGWDERLVEKVNEVLLKEEIRIRTSSAVIRVENDSGTGCSNIYLSNSESQIPSSLTVWTTGVKGYEIQWVQKLRKLKMAE